MTPAGPLLVVDDDFDVREALRDVLEEAGYAVEVAPGGHAALAWLASHGPPRLILLDWMMPEMDGEELLAILRAHAAWCNIPVLLLTADQFAARRASHMPSARYLTKPIDLADLLAAVARALSARPGPPSIAAG